jgi:hypothetical protein
MRRLAGSLVGLALLGAAPSPAPPAPPKTITVVCRYAHFYVFLPGSNRPDRTPEHDATMGERFGLLGGPRTTLEGFGYYETDVTAVEPGHRGHYWLSSDCAIPTPITSR